MDKAKYQIYIGATNERMTFDSTDEMVRGVASAIEAGSIQNPRGFSAAMIIGGSYLPYENQAVDVVFKTAHRDLWVCGSCGSKWPLSELRERVCPACHNR